MNTIIWRGVPSTTIKGLLISELPPISKPPMRVLESTVDGRDGSIIEELGYSSYDKNVVIGLRGDFDINKVIKYFTGEGEVVFSNEPDKVYTAKIVGHIDYNRLVRYRQAVIPFRVQPFKHKLNEAYKEAQTVAVSGTSVDVTGGADANYKVFSIYGKTTQNGTPTPSSPVDLVSVGSSGSITVSVTGENARSMTIATPNGLPGIPVSSGGNYTDANGQQWICDEIDLGRGVYVQRVCVKTFNGTESWNYSGSESYFSIYHSVLGSATTGLPFCTHFTLFKTSTSGYFFVGSIGFGFYHSSAGLSEWKAFLAERYSSGTPVKLAYALKAPIETPLSAEELAAFSALHTYHGSATVSNDASAYIGVECFKPYEVFNEGLETSKPIMVLKGEGTVGVSVNGVMIFEYTFPEGESEVVIDSQAEDAYLGNELKNRNMSGEFPVLLPGTNIIEWSGYVSSIEILPRSRWL